MDWFDKFINTLNQINKYINERYDYDKRTTFGEAISKARSLNNIIKRYYDELSLYNKLRNLIVHESYSGGMLGEPSIKVVSNLDKIHKEITSPMKVSKLGNNKVYSFNTNDSLKQVLKTVNEKDYSFFPVFNKEGLYGLLTSDGITKGIAKYYSDGIIDFDEIKISDIIQNDENFKNYQNIHPTNNIYDVIEIFEKNANKKSLPITLLLSNGNINKPKDIVGIITYWDLESIRIDIY